MEPIFSGKEIPEENITKEKVVAQLPQSPVRKEPEHQKRIVKRTPKAIHTPSIKAALKGEFKDDKEAVSAIDQFKQHTKAEEAEEFTAADLTAKWKEYLVRLDDRPNLQSTLSNVPELKENAQLFLELDNSIQNDLVNSIKPQLVSFLRRELKNSKIELVTKVTEKVKNKIIYTDTDKFEAMAKKNPSLIKLKQNFNLDFGEV